MKNEERKENNEAPIARSGIGFIKLSRKLEQWEWYDSPNVLAVWIHCLMAANWKEGRYHGEIVPRGSFITSNQHFADECGISVSTLRRCLKKLCESGEISIKATNERTCINVHRYAVYQDSDGSGRQTDEQTNGKRMNKRTVNERSTIEEYKEHKNIRNKDIPVFVSDIVSYLNEKTGKRYTPSRSRTVELISSQINEGYTVDDCKAVIDKKTAEWIGTDFERYLTPDTLFGSKFEKYVNQEANSGTPEYWNPQPIRNEAEPASAEEIERVKALLKRNTDHKILQANLDYDVSKEGKC